MNEAARRKGGKCAANWIAPSARGQEGVPVEQVIDPGVPAEPPELSWCSRGERRTEWRVMVYAAKCEDRNRYACHRTQHEVAPDLGGWNEKQRVLYGVYDPPQGDNRSEVDTCQQQNSTRSHHIGAWRRLKSDDRR